MPDAFSVCGVCDCNAISIATFLLGVAGGLVLYFVIKIASDRKKQQDQQ